MTLPFLRRLHKWVAIVVGVQVVLWCVSGATFSWLDHHDVSGEHLVHDLDAAPVPADLTIWDPRQWLAQEVDGAREISLQPLLDRWVYRVETPAGVTLHDAVDGRRVLVSESVVRGLAAAHYAGDGKLAAVVRHDGGDLEVRKHGPAWAARYDDGPGTTLWFSASDGTLLETRSNAWRVFDFLWMLHTMDYRGRDDFNNPLVVLFATASLWVALTGLLLVVRVFRPRPSPAPDGT